MTNKSNALNEMCPLSYTEDEVMTEPRKCEECGCELADDEEVYCEDCLWADDTEDDEDGDGEYDE